MKRMRIDLPNNFKSVFDCSTGEYARITDNDINAPDAFMSSMPELIDIGIMGRCDRGCEYCYQDAKSTGDNMSAADYFSILDQVKEDVYQVALGGAGNPNEHPAFEEIIRRTREEYNIVPSYTTNGDHLTDEQIAVSKKYCGAVAVSKHEGDNWKQAAKRLIDAGVKTNVHFILSNDTVDEAIDFLHADDIPLSREYKEKLNAVIFLLYKPFGRGKNKKEAILKSSDQFDEFCFMIKHWSGSFKIGFDSCSTPFILDKGIAHPDVLDTCEGARYSCYVGPDMILKPCSFDVDNKYGESLRTQTFKEIWEGSEFNQFRVPLRDSGCQCEPMKEWNCKGGCPLTREIVICNDEGRDYSE